MPFAVPGGFELAAASFECTHKGSVSAHVFSVNRSACCCVDDAQGVDIRKF
jgi:hypothetical protein